MIFCSVVVSAFTIFYVVIVVTAVVVATAADVFGRTLKMCRKENFELLVIVLQVEFSSFNRN